jgi:hypothetical protein
MKRTLKYALTAVLVSAFAGAAFGQSTNFPDVPENHWAYEALGRMKQEGLLMGYPDGFYRGSRMATRYELAVAMYAVWTNLKTVTDGLSEQVKALEDKEGTDSADIANLKSEVDEIKSDLAAMKGWGDDIAALQKASDEFKAEFAALNVDDAEFKKELADYGDRITSLEKVKLPFTVSGDINFLGINGYGQSGLYGLTPDGRYTGISKVQSYPSGGYYHVGADKDFSLYHELGINILSANDDPGKPTYGATVVVGNTLGYDTTGSSALGNQSSSPIGTGFSEGYESIYVDRAWVKFSTKLASANIDATVGRQGNQIDALLYKRPDTEWFYNNARWSDGDWTFDGLKVAFNAGPASIKVFGGKVSDNTDISSQGSGSGTDIIQPLTAGRISAYSIPMGSTHALPVVNPGGDLLINNELGVTAGIPISSYGKVNLAYLWLENTEFQPGGSNPQPDGVRVYGGDVDFHYDGFGIYGSYGKSDVYQGGDDIVDKYNDAWWVSVGRKVDQFDLKGGYEYIGPLYGAPGDWGRIGTWWNPTDIQGWNASVDVDLTHDISIDGKGQWLGGTGQGKNLPFNGAGAGIPTSDTVSDYNVDLKYKPGPYEASLGFELVNAKNLTPTSQYENWYNIGLGWNASENAKLSLLWQISNINLQETNSVFRGGLIATQFTVKF